MQKEKVHIILTEIKSLMAVNHLMAVTVMVVIRVIIQTDVFQMTDQEKMIVISQKRVQMLKLMQRLMFDVLRKPDFCPAFLLDRK